MARAREQGATAIVCIGETIAAAALARQVARDYPGFCHHTAGVHPGEAAQFDATRDLDALRLEVTLGAVAIGECGLDYHYAHVSPPRQRDVFAAQLQLAAELSRPVVVHTREAESDTRAMIVEAGRAGVTGVLHCFTGSTTLAAAAIDAGWMVSFSGIVTFRKWSDDALLRLIPDDRLLVESDAPYLSPVPHRGKRNEPAWVTQPMARLATARGIGTERVGELISDNARRLFRLGAPPRDITDL